MTDIAQADRIACPNCEGLGYLTPATAHTGTMIALQRKKLGISQQELAVQIGVGRSQIANIELGRSDIPTKSLRLYAQALQCQMKDLVP